MTFCLKKNLHAVGLWICYEYQHTFNLMSNYRIHIYGYGERDTVSNSTVYIYIYTCSNIELVSVISSLCPVYCWGLNL